jgi:hypothetical protein
MDFKLTVVTDICSSIHVWGFFDFGLCKSQFDFFTLLVVLDELDLKRLFSIIELVFTFKVFYSVFLDRDESISIHIEFLKHLFNDCM